MDIRAKIITSTLLESDLEFHSVLSTDKHTLDIRGSTDSWQQAAIHPSRYDEAWATLDLWWSVDIEVRDWGVKDMLLVVDRFVLDGEFYVEDHEGDMVASGEKFHYEWPEDKQQVTIGPDVDAPTPNNVYRLAQPKWRVETNIDSSENRFTIAPAEATVFMNQHVLRVEF